ncbi:MULTISPECIES: ArnT family glycosyltransferase [Sphingomonas]|uniref:ArnT family glycosyltransferase n=1 Tax=Sphingomonas TaxID=13687 RepID=UPI000DEFE37B|nr:MULTISPECIES: glycosyltransferase family 39 protein [Sphingomonas]
MADWLWVLLFLALAAAFLFVDPRTAPLALQDEARNANNALEMYLTGPSLVTTFGFQPDLWNTKPPMLIWLMDLSMTLFGPSEWSMRLPSALAALGTLLASVLFTRRTTGSLAVALTAGGMLLLSPGFFGEHGARTADFDALLTLFVTLALQRLFFAVHQARPSVASLLLIGALVAAGALTKSIAAFIPMVGVVFYLIAIGRFGRVLRQTPRFALAAATAVIPLVVFYVLRERAAPGYVAAALTNDLAGRFSQSLNVPSTPLFYLTSLPVGWFIAGPFLVAAPLAFSKLPSRAKLLFFYALAIAGFSLLVLSTATNRALQYALPVFPWLAIIAALSLRHLVGMVSGAWRSNRRVEAITLGTALGLTGLVLVQQSIDWRYHRFPERDFYPQASYGDLFATLAARGTTAVTVVDPGSLHLGRPGYAPLLRWHQLVWRERGLVAHRVMAEAPGLSGLLASCQPAVIAGWTDAQAVGSCEVRWSKPVGRSAALSQR